MNGVAGLARIPTIGRRAYRRLAPETMSFRARMVFAALVVGGLAILAASLGAYLASRNALINSVNGNLQQSIQEVAGAGPISYNPNNGLISGIYGAYAQFVPSGSVLTQPRLPVTASVRKVANGAAGAFYADVTIGGQQYREYVTPHTFDVFESPGFRQAVSGALQVAAPLGGVNLQLGHLGLALLLVALAALTLAALLGWFASRTAVGPLNELTATVEELARTTDVSQRLDPGGPDELGRLRRAFNRLLAALEVSRESQHQLVLDASHELRTPLTSLRTNLEIVRRIDELAEADREVLVADVLTQLQELTNLVGDLAELARGDHVRERAAPLRLDHLVEDAVELATSHGRTRSVSFLTSLDETWVEGRSERIARAVGNLLDNALKWSPDGGTVEVLCRGGDISVRDHGPGIDPEDLPHIFDRFYRARAARALPGSGLGLAIVAQVASEEGGSVRAVNAPDGGAIVTLHLPVVSRPAAFATQY
jgi:two-component system, OmpR family, sensor histidine kinase MprB